MPSRSRMARRIALAVAALAFAVPLPAAVAAGPLGALTELSGPAGCVTRTGELASVAAACTAATQIEQVNGIAISPDGRFAYAHGFTESYSITILARDPATGALSDLPGSDFCLTANGTGTVGSPGCINARNLGLGPEGDSMVLSKDGKFLYVGSRDDTTLKVSGIAIFGVDTTTGRLTQLSGLDGCHTDDGVSEEGAGTCRNARALNNVQGLTLSPDQRYLYAVGWQSGGDDNVSIFSRDTSTGALTQLAGLDACWSQDGSSEDGANTCRDVRGGGYTNAFSITPDGTHAYFTDYDGSSIAIMSVDPATGLLSQAGGTAGCISNTGSSEDGAGTCQDLGVLANAWSTALSPDGRTLYVAGWASPSTGVPALSIFRVDAATGALTPLTGIDHCFTNDGASAGGAGTCTDARGIGFPEQLTVSGDGRSLYMSNYDYGFAVFSLDAATGKATQLPGKDGCVNHNGDAPAPDGADVCTQVRATSSGSYRLALSPDGRFAYAPWFDAPGSITVLKRQLPPACTDTSGATAFQTPFAVTLPCTDPNGDALTREIVTGPGHGSLGGIDQAAGKVTFTPAGGFSGADSFTFRASDGGLTSAPATAALTVGAAGTTTPPPDKTAPACAGTGARTASLKAPGWGVRCNEAAALTAKLTLARKVAKKLKIGATIGSGKANTAANATTKVKIKLTAKAKKRLKKLSKSAVKKLRPTLAVTAKDAAGNSARTTRKVRLKR